jgi:Tol biopolymer transport system component
MISNNGCRKNLLETLSQMPEYDEDNVTQNHEWFNEEKVEILGYSGDTMEIGISPDGRYLLFNDRNKDDKDMHWSIRIDDRSYRYQGKVKNTVSQKVDGTPSFDAKGNVYFTTLKNYPDSNKSIYTARFRDGVAMAPVPVNGNIYVKLKKRSKQYWISLDPDISDDGRFLFYSEGRFIPGVGFPYPFNVRGAVKIDNEFIKIDDQILKEINTDNLEYAPTVSSDGLEIFFARIGKVNGMPKMVGIFTARRKSINEPFFRPEKIIAITGNVEAPVLSGDENKLYYHRMEHGVFKVYRVSRKQR